MASAEQIYCLIRQQWVAATPEEKVRQGILHDMLYRLGYPLGGIAIEKSLKQMPHLTLHPHKLPSRRADIVFFAKDIHPQYSLYPLLLVECKAVILNDKVFNQALGYNHFLGAYFIAIANHNTIKTAWYDDTLKAYQYFDALPAYEQLMSCFGNESRG